MCSLVFAARDQPDVRHEDLGDKEPDGRLVVGLHRENPDSQGSSLGVSFCQEMRSMMTVRLFLAQEPSGLVGFDDTGHRTRPAGILADDSVNAIRRDLEAGRIIGWICGHLWYRQATPYCPIDVALPNGSVRKPCPCDDELCRLDTLSA